MPEPLELESLYVRIIVDATSYDRGIDRVLEKNKNVTKSFDEIGDVVQQANKAFEKLAKDTIRAGREVEAQLMKQRGGMDALLTRMQAIDAGAMSALSAGIAKKAAGVPPIGMGPNLSGLGGFFGGGGWGIFGSHLGLGGLFAGITAGAFLRNAFQEAGQFDNELMKIEAHMGDFGLTTKAAFHDSLLRMSVESVKNVHELSAGLDVLTSSGRSASESMQELGVAEKFAIAGGIEMGHATQRLLEIQRSLKLGTGSEKERLEGMRHISDILVGMAPLVGSTVGQLSEAFGPRFTAEMRSTNMSLEEGAAILGVLSIQGLKGAGAADRAAMAIRELKRAQLEHVYLWDNFGIRVFDKTTGNMRKFSSVILDIEKSLRGSNAEVNRAQMLLQGLNNRGVASVLSFVGMGEALRNLENITEAFNDATKKQTELIEQGFGSRQERWKHFFTGVGIRVIEAADALAQLINMPNRLVKGTSGAKAFRELQEEKAVEQSERMLQPPKSEEEAKAFFFEENKKMITDLQEEFANTLNEMQEQGGLMGGTLRIGSFKQISTNRIAIGGSEAVSLDDQQLAQLRVIAHSTTALVDVMKQAMGRINQQAVISQ